MVEFKRWDRLLRIGQDLKRRDLRFVIEIAGDGPLREDLKVLAARLGVADRTRFLGYRRDLPDLIARARLVVHTSDAEGTPNAVMEAMACGRPVVATDVGDVARIVEDGVSGFVVPPGAFEKLVGRVVEVMTDDALAGRLGLAAREYAAREFGLHRLVAETFDVYRQAGWKG